MLLDILIVRKFKWKRKKGKKRAIEQGRYGFRREVMTV
jgi:hypothetical protein